MKRKMLEVCLNMATQYLPKHSEPYCHYTYIISKNKVLEWGTNRRGPPLKFLGFPNHSKIHSEVDAYFKARGLLRGDTFEAINIRLTKSGLMRDSKPCVCCYEFLMGLECKEIWFSTDLGTFARIK